MNKKIGLSMLVIFSLLGLFAGANNVSADSVTPKCTSATLYGTVYPNGATTQAWFQWGTTASMQYQTTKQTFNSTSTFSQVLNPLDENTTYYFRSVVSNVNGTAYGNIISFKTSTCTVQTPAPSVNLTADDTSISYNDSTTIRWTSQNATSCTASGGANGWSGSKPTSGSFPTGNLTSDKTYSITCTNSAGSDTDSVTIDVGNAPVQTCTDHNATNYGGPLPCKYPAQNPTVNLTADDTSIPYNGSTTIRWSSQNATSCVGSGGANDWSGTRITSGSFFTDNLTSTKTYSITCSNSSGYASDGVTIVVGNQQPQTCQDHNATNYGGPLPCKYGNNQVSVDIRADDTSIDYDSSTIIRWDSTNATSCQASGGANGWSGARQTSGTFFTDDLTSDKVYNITCSNSTSSDSDSVLVRVDDKDDDNDDEDGERPTVEIWADDTSIDEGDDTIIRWESENADECEASGGTNGWSGDRNRSGSFNTGDLTSDRTFTITCENDEGSDTDSVTIRVDEEDDDDNDEDAPNVDISADDTSIDFGDSTTIRWDVDDAEECRATGGTNGWSGDRNRRSGSFNTGSLSRDTTYTLRCENDEGSDSDSVTVRVSDDDDRDENFSAPTAVTTAANQLSNTSAQLNSLVFPAGSNTNAWFEWGPNAGLGNRTSTSPVGSSASVRHSDTITGLSTGVTYYFRVVAENPYGRSYGNTMTFFMQNFGSVSGASTTVINRPTTIINGGTGRPSLVMLTIDGGSETILAGEKRIYHVEWRNTSSQTLEKVVLRIILPEAMVFDATNSGSFSNNDNTITVDLDELRPNEDGEMIFTANAKPVLREGELVVVVANMVYTDQSDVQGDAVAYATHHGTNLGSVLGASAFGAGFLPDSVLGWLFLLILLLVIVLLIKHLQNQSRKPVPVIVQH